MKAKSYFHNYWVGIVKNKQGFIDHEIFKSHVFHKGFDELNRLNYFCMLIVREFLV